MNTHSPLMTFEVVGSSAELANATADELVRRYSDSVRALQDQARILPGDQVTASRLGSSQGAVASTGNRKRALAAVGGAGLLLTAGLTVGVDALLRRRARRMFDHDAMVGLDVPPEHRDPPSMPTVSNLVRPRTTGTSPATPTVPGSSAQDRTDAGSGLIPVYRIATTAPTVRSPGEHPLDPALRQPAVHGGSRRS